MFILCEQLEDDVLIPIINRGGYIVEFKDKEIANDERIYLQPDYDNRIVISEKNNAFK